MHKVGPKGTVVIEKGIRERLGISAGQEVSQHVLGDTVLLTFRKHREPGAAFGVLSHLPVPPEVRRRAKTDEGLNEMIDEAWGMAIIEEDGSDVR